MKPTARFVVFHAPGPRWQAGVAAFEQPGVQAHIDHYRQPLASGMLALGGPFLDAEGGGMMVAAADVSRDELAAHAASDPAVHAQLLTWRVRPWLVGMQAPD